MWGSPFSVPSSLVLETAETYFPDKAYDGTVLGTSPVLLNVEAIAPAVFSPSFFGCTIRARNLRFMDLFFSLPQLYPFPLRSSGIPPLCCIVRSGRRLPAGSADLSEFLGLLRICLILSYRHMPAVEALPCPSAGEGARLLPPLLFMTLLRRTFQFYVLPPSITFSSARLCITTCSPPPV